MQGVSPGNLLVVSSAAGTGINSVITKAISPKSILEYLINFFTFGGVRRANEKMFNDIVESMINSLHSPDEDFESVKDLRLYLDDINGCKVSFTSDEQNEDYITVEVQKNNYAERCSIDSQMFFDVCRTLMLRNEFDIPQDPVILTDSGKLNLRGADLSNKNLAYKNLRNADLSDAILFRANLAGTDLSDAKLYNTDLSNANLSGADLSNSDLTGSVLYNANLSYSDLSYADLSCANLSNATLLSADLSNADLSCANLFNANLLGVDSSNANLTCAKLVNAKAEEDFLIDAGQCPGADIDKIIFLNLPEASQEH